jgi:hypothetical protein
MLAGKWLLITFFIITSLKITVHWYVLSLMDIAAVTSVMSLLDAQHVLLYYFITIVLKELMNPVLKKFGDAGAYPFLPVVLTATTVIFFVMSYGGLAIEV